MKVFDLDYMVLLHGLMCDNRDISHSRIASLSHIHNAAWATHMQNNLHRGVGWGYLINIF